ncbi:MAG: amino acid permease [bacterium]
MKKLIKNLGRKISPEKMISNSKETGLKKSLTAFDLVILGVGAIIGTGIFSLAGEAISGSVQAGPSFTLSIILASFVCMFSALSYAELSTMLPVSGSAYTYTYATLGEFAAWLMAWVLVLEYAIGNITVAKSWTHYMINFLKGFPFLPAWATEESVWIHQYHIGGILIDLHIPAILLLTAITACLYKGVQESAKAAAIMVYIKLAVIFMFIFVGGHYVRPENWSPFAPSGFAGIIKGAFIITLAYIGFDAVSTAAEETKNPQKDLPIGLLGSLTICAVIYALVSAVLTGMMPWQLIDTGAPIAVALNYVHQDWVAGFISLGALTGMTSVLLVLQLGVTRILFSVARDNFLPKSLTKIHPEFKTPYVITVVSGLFTILGTLFLSLKNAANISNVGAILAFSVVSICLIVMRYQDPHRPRPFRVPGAPFVPIVGIILSLFIVGMGIAGNPMVIAIFLAWMAIGVAIYFGYSYKKTSVNYLYQVQEAEDAKKSNLEEAEVPK